MELEGIHHISAITGDAAATSLYTRVSASWLTAKSVNRMTDRLPLFYGVNTRAAGR
jgi:hypothetical protein